jgi:hypothetical protein
VSVCEITPLVDPAGDTFNNIFSPRGLDQKERYIELEKDNGNVIRIPIRRILAVDPPLTDAHKPILRLQPGACIRGFDDLARWRFDG